MTIPTSRENSTRALSTADLATASRRAPRVSPDPHETEEDTPEEAIASQRAGASPDLPRGRAETAPDSQDTDYSSRDDDIGRSGDVRQAREVQNHRGDEMRSGGLRPGNVAGGDGKPGAPAVDSREESLEPLFAAEQAEGFRNRWIAIQSSFVDDPSAAVRAGDELVAQVMSELASSFAGQRDRIESQLSNAGPQRNTEDLRVALRSYRSFFERLLSL